MTNDPDDALPTDLEAELADEDLDDTALDDLDDLDGSDEADAPFVIDLIDDDDLPDDGADIELEG